MGDRERYTEPPRQAAAWLVRLHRFWSAFLDALEGHLEQMDEESPARAKTKIRREE